jgi:hypothetical protein
VCVCLCVNSSYFTKGVQCAEKHFYFNFLTKGASKKE